MYQAARTYERVVRKQQRDEQELLRLLKATLQGRIPGVPRRGEEGPVDFYFEIGTFQDRGVDTVYGLEPDDRGRLRINGWDSPERFFEAKLKSDGKLQLSPQQYKNDLAKAIEKRAKVLEARQELTEQLKATLRNPIRRILRDILYSQEVGAVDLGEFNVPVNDEMTRTLSYGVDVDSNEPFSVWELDWMRTFTPTKFAEYVTVGQIWLTPEEYKRDLEAVIREAAGKKEEPPKLKE